MGIRSRIRQTKQRAAEHWAVMRGRGLRSVRAIDENRFLALFDNATAGLSGDASAEENTARLLAHYESRTSGRWPALPAKLTDLRIDLSELVDDEIVARADAALANDLHPSGVRPRLRAGGRIDWTENPADSREWLLMLHRHAWWPLWGRAFELTGDEKYACAFVEQAVDWIESNPMPPFKAEHYAPWRLMECGLRLRLSWIPAFGCFYRAAAFSDAAKFAFLRSVYDHCNFLFHYCTNRNHLVRESNGLLAAATTCREFRDSAAWMSEAIARLDREVRAQVNADGSHIEMSVGYQWLAIDEFEVTRELLEAVGARLPNVDLERTLERMYEFLAAVMRPDREFPQLNDGFILWDADRLAAAARRLGRTDLEFAATGGARGETPAFTSRSFPHAGLHVMRSGWGQNENYLVFDTGPYGGPHGHEDKLSFEVSARGVPFIVDPGSYTYQPDDPFRRYFVGSEGHNTVLVDGNSQVRRWIPAHLNPAVDSSVHGEWETDERLDRAGGVYDEGYAEFVLTRPDGVKPDDDVIHAREIVFVKPDVWVIADVLTSQTEHDFTTLFHLAPGIIVTEHAGNATELAAERSAARLSLYAMSAATDMWLDTVVGREEPPQGWYSPDHHRKVPAPALAFTVRGGPLLLNVWLLVSHSAKAEDRPAVSFRPPEGGNALSMTVVPAKNAPAHEVSVAPGSGGKPEIRVAELGRRVAK